MTMRDIETTDVRELDWLYSRLVKQKKDEIRLKEEQLTGRKRID